MSRRRARLAVAALGAALWAAAPAAPAAELLGQRLKLGGRLEDGRFVADRLQHRDPRRDPRSGRIRGAASGVDPNLRRLRIGPFELHWTEDTRLRGLSESDLRDGVSLEVSVRLAHGGRLVARRIEPAPDEPGRFELLGTVTAESGLSDDPRVVTILGASVSIPPALATGSLGLTRNPDDRRPDDQLTLGRGRWFVRLGGELEARTRFDSNFDLGEDGGRERLRYQLAGELEIFAGLGPRAFSFLEGNLVYEGDLDTRTGRSRDEAFLERGETWLYLVGPAGFAFQAGRQAFREPRQWWWDQDLDSLRLRWSRFPWAAELGVAYELFPVSTSERRIEASEEDVLRVLGRLSWRTTPDLQLDLFGLYQADHSERSALGAILAEEREDPVDAELAWVGLRVSGDPRIPFLGEPDFWLDTSYVWGRETLFGFDDAAGGSRVESQRRRSVSGWALDAGVVWPLPLPGEPALTLGWAVGSGDRDPASDRDGAFRQSGLQNNNNRFRGVDRFRYYGELLRPELSNLHIATAALGMRLLDSSSVELVYHYYRQLEPAPFLRGASLRSDPDGDDPEIGHEIDLVFGFEDWEPWEIELIGAAFLAGRAYGPREGEAAFRGELKINFNF